MIVQPMARVAFTKLYLTGKPPIHRVDSLTTSMKIPDMHLLQESP
jgi:hypothetical protein